MIQESLCNILFMSSFWNCRLFYDELRLFVEIRKLIFFSLSQQQKQTRVDWIVDELKKSSVLPADVSVDTRMFAMRSADQV